MKGGRGVRANPRRTVRFSSQRTQQAAVCRAKSMRGGDRELPPLALLFPPWVHYPLPPLPMTWPTLFSRPFSSFGLPPLFLPFACSLLLNLRRTNAPDRAHPRCDPPPPTHSRSRSPAPSKRAPDPLRANKLYYFYHGPPRAISHATLRTIRARRDFVVLHIGLIGRADL